MSRNSLSGLAGTLFLAISLLSNIGTADEEEAHAPFVMALGIAQDGGYPHAGCKRECCQSAWNDPLKRRLVTCLAIVDPQSNERWFVECTPDFPAQLEALDRQFPVEQKPGINGILLTHAHVGHYAGLMHLGREVLGARNVKVFAMPKMRTFLTDNGPWSQLVALSNIRLASLTANEPTQLNARLRVTPLLVPHRDEFSETVGFLISGPRKTLLFLPDINKWHQWETDVEEILAKVDVAYLDGTFYANGEIPGRDMAEIPHPFIAESIERFATLPATERAKVQFIHLNHTNPALQADSAARREIIAAGHDIVEQGEKFSL